ncbi:integrase core domain-containing protein [Streptomyces similanensis]|uniref:Integrase catalytic domain-containing protein n=1 Tax=Streptomyces similanensis TaxID=1274988 RepID=A0ABP9KW26_9ACTN
MQGVFTTVRHARLEIFQWLTYYNARRRYSSLGYLSPVGAACQPASVSRDPISSNNGEHGEDPWALPVVVEDQ